MGNVFSPLFLCTAARSKHSLHWTPTLTGDSCPGPLLSLQGSLMEAKGRGWQGQWKGTGREGRWGSASDLPLQRAPLYGWPLTSPFCKRVPCMALPQLQVDWGYPKEALKLWIILTAYNPPVFLKCHSGLTLKTGPGNRTGGNMILKRLLLQSRQGTVVAWKTVRAVRREAGRGLSDLHEVLIGNLLNVERSGQGVSDKAQTSGLMTSGSLCLLSTQSSERCSIPHAASVRLPRQARHRQPPSQVHVYSARVTHVWVIFLLEVWLERWKIRVHIMQTTNLSCFASSTSW